MLPKEIIDNTENNKLVDFLNYCLKIFPNSNLDIATAYFNVGAYLMLRENLKNVKRFRLLIGKPPKVKEENLGEKLLKRIRKELENLDFSKINEEGIRDFINFLKKENVEVRLSKKFLHGKAYIFDKLVIIGSSNFTPAGLTRKGELNSVALESYAKYTRENWFEKYWAEAIDFKEELIKILEESKFGSKEYTPYEIFIKAIYELQKDEIRSEEEEAQKSLSRVELTEFQEDAIPRIYSRLRKYGGVLIADSVGLGKTWIAKRIIEDFGFFKRKNYLVICPAQLRDSLWRKELKDLLLAENIISIEELSLDDFMKRIENTVGKNRIKDIELIVVDESHNLRNPLSKRWENFLKLYERIVNEGGLPYLVFLTATPINNTIWDLYWQIILLVGMNEAAFIKTGIKNLYEFFKYVEVTGNFSLLNDVLNEISIRRTREYIVKNYPNATINGKPIRFPKRKLENISYSLEETYSGMFKKIANNIENLTMASYNILRYKLKEKITKEEKEEIERMMALSGILKTILLKRLESSVEAFRISIKKQIEFLEKLKQYIKKGKYINKKAFNKYLLKLDEELDDSEKEEFLSVLEDINLEDFNKEELFRDIDKDIQLFKEIENIVKDLNPEKDAKLNTVKKYLEKLHKNGQIIIFSYYVDTINYIFEELKKSKEFSKLRIEKISGDLSIDERNKLVEEFTKNNIDILLSTDVLSEGMNLQTAKIVINYDLHWNPIKLLQRAGRIDRIGSPHEEIFIYNVFPEKELEELLRLVEKIQEKIRTIDETIGLDQSILGEKIHPKVFGTIRKIIKKDEKIFEELEASSFGGGEKFYQPLREFINRVGIEEIEKIPYGVYSGLKKNMNLRGIFFYYKYGDDVHFWYLYDIINNRFIKSKTEIIDYISCKPTEKRIIPDFFNLIYDINERTIQEIEKDYKEIEQELKDPKIGRFSMKRSTVFIRTMIREIESVLQQIDYTPQKNNVLLVNMWNNIREKLLNVYLSKRRISDLRKIWKNYKKNQRIEELLHNLNIFLKEIPSRRDIILKPFDRKKLKLVVIDFIS